MPAQFWSSLLNSPNPAAGPALASSATLSDISPGSAAPAQAGQNAIVLPANFLYVGQVLRLTAYGVFSNTGTPTLLLGFYYGTTSTALAATGATTTTTGATNWPWRAEMTATVRATGTSGSVITQGFVDLATSLTAVTRIPIPATALATVTINTTTANEVLVGAQWGTSSSSNTITCHQFLVEALN